MKMCTSENDAVLRNKEQRIIENGIEMFQNRFEKQWPETEFDF